MVIVYGRGHGNDVEFRFPQFCLVCRKLNAARLNRITADFVGRVDAVFIQFDFLDIQVITNNFDFF